MATRLSSGQYYVTKVCGASSQDPWKWGPLKVGITFCCLECRFYSWSSSYLGQQGANIEDKSHADNGRAGRSEPGFPTVPREPVWVLPTYPRFPSRKNRDKHLSCWGSCIQSLAVWFTTSEQNIKWYTYQYSPRSLPTLDNKFNFSPLQKFLHSCKD